jgi:hypothetical protein
METKIGKFDIAVLQLNRAIKLFLEEKEFCSVITLAGAAEEILGKLSERIGKKSALSQGNTELSKKWGISESDINDKYTNRIKNNLKHAGNPSEDNLIIDQEMESIQYILRGITNYNLLRNGIMQQHIEFLNFIKTNFPNLYDQKNQYNYEELKE